MNRTLFTQKWMNAREIYDSCSRSSILNQYLSSNKNVFKNIIDIGCGTGSFLRWMIINKYKFENFLMIDHDKKLLNKVYKITKNSVLKYNMLFTKKSINCFHLKESTNSTYSEIKTIMGDICKLFKYIDKYDFISFSAIADILPKLYLDKLFDLQLSEKIILFSICYDGNITWNYKNKYDRYIIKKFNEHQHSIKNDNYMLGPKSVSYIKKKSKKKNYKIRLMDSSWNLESKSNNDKEFHRQYIDTIFKPLKSDNSIDISLLKEWVNDKYEKIEKGKLKTIVHHKDILVQT